jgi:hypothetical protein
LNRRPVVAPKRDVGPVEDRADLLDRVVRSRGGDKLSIVRYTCQLDEGVVPPARPMRMARVVAAPSVLVLDESTMRAVQELGDERVDIDMWSTDTDTSISCRIDQIWFQRAETRHHGIS